MLIYVHTYRLFTKIVILLSLCLFSGFKLLGQTDSIVVIDDLTKDIDNSPMISKATFSASEVYRQITDNGGEIIVLYEGENIFKITQEIGLSWGFISTTFYFKDDLPIKIIEIERNFRWNENESKFDYTKLDQVFYWEYYIFDYDRDQGVINRTGDPVFSEPVCGLYEYEDEIERIRSYYLKVHSE